MDRPIIKDKAILAYVESLEEKFKSPYYSSFMAGKTTVERWNKQILDAEVNILDPEHKSIFQMVHTYLTEQKPYLDQLAYLLKLMTPEEIKLGERKMNEQSTAERHIFKVE